MSSFGPTAYNIDINQLGASQFPRFAVTQPTPYQDGLVEDVILNELHPEYAPDGSNVGMVKVRFIPGDRGVPNCFIHEELTLLTKRQKVHGLD